jgi:transcriptional regulator with XRE-family HTH domain
MSRDEFKQKQAQELRDERLQLGLTQADVAAALHVAESTVSRWECAERSPGVYDLRRLRRLFRDRAARRELAVR